MYAERLAKVDQLKPICFTYNGRTYTANRTTLNALFKQAIQLDIANAKAGRATNNVLNFKEAVYKAYILDSDDFKQSIYQ